jgi:hypothetical protein
MIGLVSGIRFVLDKVAAAVDGEMRSEDRLRQELLDAQMRHELGELSGNELAAIETDLLAHLRAIKEEKMGPSPADGGVRVTGAEATFVADEEHG